MIYSVKHFFFLMCIVLENINIISGRYLTIYRHLWNAQDEKSPLSRFHLPIKYYHTDVCKTSACDSTESCSLIVKKVQDEHMNEKGLPDIAYNFLVDGSGNVYEGTGWYSRAIQHGKEFLSIGLFGIENYEKPPNKFVDGLKKILDFGKEIGYMAQKIKPLFNVNSNAMTDDDTERFKQQQDWVQKSTDLDLQDRENEGINGETTKINDIDWSKVFPNQGNQSALDRIISNKTTVSKKSDWSKVFQNKDQIISIDWSSLLRHSSINSVNWTKIFEDNDDEISNLRSLFSSQIRVNYKLGRNNNW